MCAVRSNISKIDYNSFPDEVVKRLPEQLHSLTPVQSLYLHDWDHRFIIVSAGRRSRKSLIAKYKIYLYAINTPKVRLFQAAPTRQQAKDIFWEPLKKALDIFIIETHETDLTVKLFNGSLVKIATLETTKRIEGISWHGCHITELPDAKPGTWDAISIMLSETNPTTGKKGFAILDGVPDMTNKEHRELAFMACDNNMPETIPGYGAYVHSKLHPEWAFYTWFSADVIGEEEVEKQRERLDPRTFRQEFQGSYEKLTGSMYYGYIEDYYPNGNLDKSIVYDPNLPIVMGFDFNVNPMTAVLGHIKRSEKGQQEYHLFKGYFLHNSNTAQLIERILIEHEQTVNYFLTPCQSSNNRQTVADIGVTDERIIKNTCRRYEKNLSVKKREKNPIIKDRVAAMNSMLYHNRLRMNPTDPGIKYLMKDLLSMTWLEGTTKPDESDKMMGHISAACGYVVEKHWPIRQEGNDNLIDKIIM